MSKIKDIKPSKIPVKSLVAFWENVAHQQELSSTPSTKVRKRRSLAGLKRRVPEKKHRVSPRPSDTVVYTIRHGERIDHVDAKWSKSARRPFDAPLSERGKRQAKEAGEKLLRDKAKISTIYTSPFYRTVQTAAVIQSVLEKGLKTKIPLFIETGIAESIRTESVESWEKKERRKFPGIQTLSTEELKKEFASVYGEYNCASITYPETEEQLFQRICKVVESLPEEGKEILLVSHQMPAEYLVFELCAGIAQDKYVSYCCLSKARRKPGQRHFTLEYQHEDNFLSEPERGR